MDIGIRGLQFAVDDLMLLCVSPMQGIMRFAKKEKQSSCYIGPYNIIQGFFQVAYELELPQEHLIVHLIFHISMLQKCVGDPSHITSIEDI